MFNNFENLKEISSLKKLIIQVKHAIRNKLLHQEKHVMLQVTSLCSDANLCFTYN